jgi:hypothetical protein
MFINFDPDSGDPIGSIGNGMNGQSGWPPGSLGSLGYKNFI